MREISIIENNTLRLEDVIIGRSVTRTKIACSGADSHYLLAMNEVDIAVVVVFVVVIIHYAIIFIARVRDTTCGLNDLPKC